MNAKILITGGAGFIGHHLVARLLQRGHEIVVLDNFSTGRRENLPAHPKLRVVEGDIRHDEPVKRALDEVGQVVHLAAMVSVQEAQARPDQAWATNVHASLKLWKQARLAGVKRFVFASSSAVYGEGDGLPQNEAKPLAPLALYGAQKAAVDEALRATSDERCRAICLRLFNVYGPNQRSDGPYSAVISAFAERVYTGQALRIFGDGAQLRDFVAVEDVVSAFELALHAADDVEGSYNVAAGEAVSIKELAEKVIAIVGAGRLEYEEARATDIRISRADITEIRRVMGYAPTLSLDKGLRAYLANLPLIKP